MLPSVDDSRKRLRELRAIEAQLAEYEKLYSDPDELAIGSGPVLTFDAVEVRLSGVTQVMAALGALRRSVEIQEALLSAQLTRIERRPAAKAATDKNDVNGDPSDAVEP